MKLIKQKNNGSGFILDGEKKTFYIITIIVSAVFIPLSLKNYYLGYSLLGTSLLTFTIALFTYALAIKRNIKSSIHQNIVVSLLIVCLILTVYYVGVDAVLWAFPVVIGLVFIIPIKAAYIFNGIIFFAMSWSALIYLELVNALRFSFSLLITITISSILLKHIEKLQHKLKDDSIRDPLTGVYNRRHLAMHLEACIAQKKRNNIDSAILMLDIDYFKKINDQFGHDVGDKVIKKIANLLVEYTREVDSVFRVGGEEFILLMQGTSPSSALNVANKLRKIISKEKIIDKHPVTVSIGVCLIHENHSEDNWIKCADKALYKAKESGRNQVQLYDT